MHFILTQFAKGGPMGIVSARPTTKQFFAFLASQKVVTNFTTNFQANERWACGESDPHCPHSVCGIRPAQTCGHGNPTDDLTEQEAIPKRWI
jgi:hypothetical protein